MSLPDGESWLTAPVLAGCCKMESLVDGSLTIYHVAMLNDALAVQAENRRRAAQRH